MQRYNFRRGAMEQHVRYLGHEGLQRQTHVMHILSVHTAKARLQIQSPIHLPVVFENDTAAAE